MRGVCRIAGRPGRACYIDDARHYRADWRRDRQSPTSLLKRYQTALIDNEIIRAARLSGAWRLVSVGATI